MRTPKRTALALALAALLAVAGVGAAHAGEIDLDVEIPDVADEPLDVTNAQLRWGINEEAGSGAFAGGCNFLSAGEVGNTGGSKVWTQEDGYFRASEGAVSIEKPVTTSRGVAYRAGTFADRCKDADGRTVSASSPRGTGIQLVIDEGTGRVDPATGDAKISWKGSVTVVFYGGLTYWWFTDPVLEVTDGRGTLTATAGGYGTSRDAMDEWNKLTPTKIVLAELSDVSLRGEKGFAALPAYRGVTVDVPADAPSQLRSGDSWGSFPQSFVNFQELTGQQAFWYSSGGVRDVAKPATVLGVSYDAADPQDPDETGGDDDAPDDDGETDDETPPKNPVTPPPTVKPAPPATNLPPSAGATGGGSTPAVHPAAVPAVTVLPAAEPLALAHAATLAETGTAPPGLVGAGAAVVLGAALTVLGYRRSWLVWPTAARKGAS